MCELQRIFLDKNEHYVVIEKCKFQVLYSDMWATSDQGRLVILVSGIHEFTDGRWYHTSPVIRVYDASIEKCTIAGLHLFATFQYEFEVHQPQFTLKGD